MLLITVSATVKKQRLKVLAISSVLFIIVLLIFYQMKTNKMGGTCGTYGEEKRITQKLGGQNWVKDTTWKTQA